MKRGWVAVALVALVAFGACKGNESKPIDPTGTTAPAGSSASAPTPTAGDPFEAGLVELEAFRARMCACNDVPCTDKIFEEFKLWRVEIRKKGGGKRPSRDVEQKGNALDRAMRACRANVTAKPGSAATAGSNMPSDLIEAALVQVGEFKSKMCACTNKACADAVQTDYATWQRNLRTKLVEKPNKLQRVRGQGIETEMKECRKKAEAGTAGAAGGTPKIDTMLAQMQGFRDRLCACTSKDCATKLQTEMKTWQARAANDLADAKPTKAQDDKADRLDAEMKACVKKLK